MDVGRRVGRVEGLEEGRETVGVDDGRLEGLEDVGDLGRLGVKGGQEGREVIQVFQVGIGGRQVGEDISCVIPEDRGIHGEAC